MSSTNKNEVILYSVEKGVALITLNRPAAYNALSNALSAGIVDCITQADNDDEVKAIVITGNGKAFSAGVDLKELAENPDVLADDTALIKIFKERKNL